MNQLNSIILEGNVVRPAELSEPSEGFKVCRVSVAVNRSMKKDNGEVTEEVSYFDVESYGKMAEICKEQALKGRAIRIVGRLKQNRWKDQDGKSHSKVFVVSEHMEFKTMYQPTENSKTEKPEKAKETVKEEAVAF